MKIALIGNFDRLHDEEYIACSFESLGETVVRIPITTSLRYITKRILDLTPDLVLFPKWTTDEDGRLFLKLMRSKGIRTACWLFDLYFDYPREYRTRSAFYFGADHVFSTDGGHDEQFKTLGINHKLLRQGIYSPECICFPSDNPHGVLFVGSANPLYAPRAALIKDIASRYSDFRWVGKKDTNAVRGLELNKLYATAKVVVGDSVYSPHYWSNRVVETLGRGGFLIHCDVPGLRDAYPHIVTYAHGNEDDLYEKIDYYLSHDEERERLRRLNYEYVSEHYTAEQACAKLLELL